VARSPKDDEMTKYKLLLPAGFLLALAGCNQPDAEAPGSTTATPAESIDADPTPQTGTGGPSETVSPDGSTTVAPEQN